MEEKILYYLGAGASANALPLARSVKFPYQIAGLSQALRTVDDITIKRKITSEDDEQMLGEVYNRFNKLAQRADDFGDVDTYAKYLYIKGNSEEFEEVKQTLSEFFSIQQLFLSAVDRRYLSWLVSIMNSQIFPSNVKILSWNYDFQIQLAYEDFSAPEDVGYEGSSFTYSASSLIYYPNLDPTFSDHVRLSLIHLNGIAGYTRGNNLGLGSVFQQKYRKDLHRLLVYFKANKGRSAVHFAWEKGERTSKLLEYVRGMIQDSTIMVVVGYSFPFFNREVDKEIFDELKRNNKIKKIYFQDPVLNGEQLRAQFNLPDKLPIVHIEKITNFHIPFEY